MPTKIFCLKQKLREDGGAPRPVDAIAAIPSQHGHTPRAACGTRIIRERAVRVFGGRSGSGLALVFSAVFEAAAFVLPATAFSQSVRALEIEQIGKTVPFYPARPVIDLNDPTTFDAPGACSKPLQPDFEGKLESEGLMVRLPVPFENSGRQFEWRIGTKDGTTYWHRKQLDDGRSQISIYIPTEGLHLNFFAAYASWYVLADKKNKVDPLDEIQGEAAFFTADLTITVFDKTTAEQISLYYSSDIRSDDSYADGAYALSPQNRNLWISLIAKKSVQC